MSQRSPFDPFGAPPVVGTCLFDWDRTGRCFIPGPQIAVDHVSRHPVHIGAELLVNFQTALTETAQRADHHLLYQVPARFRVAGSSEHHDQDPLLEPLDQFRLRSFIALANPLRERFDDCGTRDGICHRPFLGGEPFHGKCSCSHVLHASTGKELRFNFSQSPRSHFAPCRYLVIE